MTTVLTFANSEFLPNLLFAFSFLFVACVWHFFKLSWQYTWNQDIAHIWGLVIIILPIDFMVKCIIMVLSRGILAKFNNGVIFVCRVGKHKDRWAGTANSNSAELRPSGPALHPPGAALWRASTGEALLNKTTPNNCLKDQPVSIPVCLICVFCSVYQGLGLLINLVEYSSRNRHCLVDMEYYIDNTCLEDSLMQPADPTQSDTAAESLPSTAETQGDGADKPKTFGALAALVKVGVVPGLINKYFSHCGFFLSLLAWVFHDFFWSRDVSINCYEQWWGKVSVLYEQMNQCFTFFFLNGKITQNAYGARVCNSFFPTHMLFFVS